jgi:hypothetical protein
MIQLNHYFNLLSSLFADELPTDSLIRVNTFCYASNALTTGRYAINNYLIRCFWNVHAMKFC